MALSALMARIGIAGAALALLAAAGLALLSDTLKHWGDRA